MANSVDPTQIAPLGAVLSGSTLSAQTCLSENLGSLRVEREGKTDGQLYPPKCVSRYWHT